MDVDEPGNNGIDDDDQDGIVPEVGVPNSLSNDEPGHQENSGNTENVSSEFIVSHWGVGSNESRASFTVFLALSG